ncbi:hypothetical protein GGI00_003821, partial [Coemansia sp. RSA 2681]
QRLHRRGAECLVHCSARSPPGRRRAGHPHWRLGGRSELHQVGQAQSDVDRARQKEGRCI